MISIEDAIIFAVSAHKEQVDKGGEPYIFHPLRVMMQMETHEERLTALFHDVLEDTEMTEFNLKARECPTSVINAVICLTHKKNQPREEYCERILQSDIAIKVKLADITDNTDPIRLNQLDNATQERLLKKYAKMKDWLIDGKVS